MGPDDEVCLCFHVTKRKIVNYIRVQRPQRAAQLADCFGAGTGCGWCRPFLARFFHHAQPSHADNVPLPTANDYARQRAEYVRAGKGTPPPGATPIEPRK